jgi:UDP-glucose 4-epimerase
MGPPKRSPRSIPKGDTVEVLVTGGAGFVGSHLVDSLVTAGHSVTVIDDLSNGRMENLAGSLGSIRVVEKDITEPPETWFESAAPAFDVVYNLACWPRSRSFADPKRDVEVNVIGMVHSILLALESKARVIFSSNSGIYDTSSIPIDESTPDSPKTPYDLDKLTAEEFLKIYGDNFGLDFVIFRFATVYGPRQRTTEEWKPVVVEFIDKLKRGVAPSISWDGNQTRDLIYVKDLVKALVLALDSEAASRRTMILGTGVETSVNKLFETVSAQLGADIEPMRTPKIMGDIARMRYDCARAESILGWKASTPLEQGVAEIIASLG